MSKKQDLHKLSDEALRLVAERFKALSDPSRLKLLTELMIAEKTVGELVEVTGFGQANVSRHLQTLLRSGILARRKDRLNVYYAISDACIPQLCELMCGSLRRQLESNSRIFE